MTIENNRKLPKGNYPFLLILLTNGEGARRSHWCHQWRGCLLDDWNERQSFITIIKNIKTHANHHQNGCLPSPLVCKLRNIASLHKTFDHFLLSIRKNVTLQKEMEARRKNIKVFLLNFLIIIQHLHLNRHKNEKYSHFWIMNEWGSWQRHPGTENCILKRMYCNNNTFFTNLL